MSHPRTAVIGLDCATDARKVGMALGFATEALTIEEARLATSSQDIENTIVAWFRSAERTLLCIDAPLGWPAAMGAELAQHEAGSEIGTAANQLFRRETDRVIKARLGKTPLDVGADRIARTAHAALAILARIRRHVPIQMAWGPGEAAAARCIEVYPAATLIAHGIETKGYKKAEAKDLRFGILRQLPLSVSDDGVLERCGRSDDVLDAVVCVVAGQDFLNGDAIGPEDDGLARKEGWIWAANRTR